MNQSTGNILDGRAISRELRQDVAARVQALQKRGGVVSLDAILVDSEPLLFSHESPARTYAQSQYRACQKVGIEYRFHMLPPESGVGGLASTIRGLNGNPNVSAIMLHLPLPEGVDAFELQSLIDPQKDVEGLNPVNIGNVVYGRSSLVPCTALAITTMIQSTGTTLQGKCVVCVGASDHVGKPTAVLMMRDEATVISCTKYTKNLAELTRQADVLIVAVGKAHVVSADMVKEGAVVIDVGFNRLAGSDGKLVGDVDFDEVKDVAVWISPVPGGVGPVTVAMLLRNTVDAAEAQFSE